MRGHLTLIEGATKVQFSAISAESALSDALASDGESTGYNYGPCRNRTYNLLVAALRGFWQNVTRLMGGTPKYSWNADAESTLRARKGATKVQLRVEPSFWAPRLRAWWHWKQYVRSAQRIKTRGLNPGEVLAIQAFMRESRGGDMTHPLRASLPPLPERMSKLPVDERGYPVPFFVAWIDGKPDHRVADQAKMVYAHRHGVCHLCGQPLGSFKAFVVGPMCGVNRISSDPPSHRECAVWAAVVCPFLTRPRAKRREAGMPEDAKHAAGHAILRNPGVTLVWVTKSYRVVPVPGGIGGLFKMGEPTEILFFAEGRPATRAEIDESVDSGLPLLREPAEAEGADAVAALEQMTDAFRRLLPAEASV